MSTEHLAYLPPPPPPPAGGGGWGGRGGEVFWGVGGATPPPLPIDLTPPPCQDRADARPSGSRGGKGGGSEFAAARRTAPVEVGSELVERGERSPAGFPASPKFAAE